MMFVGGIFVYFLVPETKNIPLEAMDALWDGDYPPRNANKRIMTLLREQSGMVGTDGGAVQDKPESEFVEKV